MSANHCWRGTGEVRPAVADGNHPGVCTCLVLLLIGRAFAQVDTPAEQRERVSAKAEKLIDSLASSNPAPQCIDRLSEGFVLFDAAYDWDDQERVLKALEDLVELEGNDVWPVLVAHIDDKAYAVTYSIDDSPINASVGSLCKKQATLDLLAAYHQYCPEVKGVNRLSQHWTFWAPADDLRGGLQKWYRQRRGKALWELQIETCEWAINKAPGLEHVSKADKDKFVSEVTNEIERLKRTHEPVIRRDVLHGIFFETYTPERAQASRNLYEKRLKRAAEREQEREAKKKLDEEREDRNKKKD